MDKNRVKILITNDDGYESPGLLALIQELKEVADLIIAVPEKDQSGISHKVTFFEVLRYRRRNILDGVECYTVSGTPADCVKIALSRFIKAVPDIVVSGINLGANTGHYIRSSGTAAAAMEGIMHGIPAIAVSVAVKGFTFEDCAPAARYVSEIIPTILAAGLPSGTMLNINIPGLPWEEIRGVRISSMACSRLDDIYEERLDPWGKPYYWLTGANVRDGDMDATDEAVLREKMISISPLQFDLTNYKAFDMLKTLKL